MSLFVTFNPVAGAHAKVVVGLTSDTVSCTLSPAQKAICGVFTVITGTAFTFTEASSEVSRSLVAKQVVIARTLTVCVGEVEKVAFVAEA
ncbi:hypothetical protein D3C80_1160970 [compost metagenome]